MNGWAAITRPGPLGLSMRDTANEAPWSAERATRPAQGNDGHRVDPRRKVEQPAQFVGVAGGQGCQGGAEAEGIRRQ